MIYIVFILLFLAMRWMQKRRGLSARENLVNTIDLLAEAVRGTFDEHDRARVLALLNGAGGGPLVEPLGGLVLQGPADDRISGGNGADRIAGDHPGCSITD